MARSSSTAAVECALEALNTPVDIWATSIAQFLSQIPPTFLRDWDIYDGAYRGRPTRQAIVTSSAFDESRSRERPSQSITVAYVPQNIAPTPWVCETNWAIITHTQHYEQIYDLDRHHDTTTTERRYLIYGPFVNTALTRSVGKLTHHLDRELRRVVEITKFNSRVERITAHSRQSTAENDDWYKNTSVSAAQISPVSHVPGSDDTLVAELAGTFGSYIRLHKTPTAELRTHVTERWHPDAEQISAAVKNAVAAYEHYTPDQYDFQNEIPDQIESFPSPRPSIGADSRTN